MDNPLANVPKWAWLASGGVVVGIGAYKFLHKGTVTDTSTPADATSPGDYGQTGQGFTSGYVDVPYSGAGTVESQAPADYAGLISSLADYQQASQQPQESVSDIINALAPLMGGGPPNSGATQDGPAVPPAAPPPVAPAPKSSAPAPCPAKYPFKSDRGCYQVYCAPKGGSRKAGRWHLYASAPDQWIHGLPC